jgi:glycosyltransferase involved in cell wall biosynthesis
MNIYFIINCSRNHKNIVNSGSGASEFLFYITAYKLSKYCNVTIYNRENHHPQVIDNINYLYLDNDRNFINNINNSIVIVQRDFDFIYNLHKKNHNNRYILWSHDHIQNNKSHLFNSHTPDNINKYFSMNNIDIVVVSDFHKDNISKCFPDLKIYRIYNAVFPEYIVRNPNISYDKNQIVFASNWGKGIEKILKIGLDYSKINTDFKLILLKPNYCNWEPDLSIYPFVKMIGTIKNKIEYCELLQKSLCVLTTSYPETFGCVFAEALHLGVPVIGDNSVKAGFQEIIKPEYLCNFNDHKKVINIIDTIRENIVKLDDKFYEDSVIKEWIKLF